MQRPWTNWFVVMGLGAALVCYYLPWTDHITAGFTMNGFDLAEWSSLHPAVRNSSPPMLTSFLLRVPQLILAIALALAGNWPGDARSRWVIRLLAGLLIMRFLPPADFLTSARSDPNYRQMILLAGLGWVGVGAAWGLYFWPWRGQAMSLAALLVVGLVASWAGLSRVEVLLDNFAIDVTPGVGLIGLSLISAGLVIGTAWRALKSGRPQVI